MPRANYTGGFKDGLSVRGVALQIPHTGKTFYVCNSSVSQPLGIGGSDSNDGLTPERPLSTIDTAVGLCTAGRGDTIIVMPGHAETISSAGGIALDVSGVKVIGLGEGTLRPTITLDTATTASITVSAANVVVSNLIISANFADIVTVFDVSAVNFSLEQCLIKATATNMNFLSVVTTSATINTCDGLRVADCNWLEPDLATLHLVNSAGTHDNVRIERNYVHLGVNNNKAALLNLATGKIVTRLQMLDNIVFRLNTDTATGGILLHTDGSTLTGVVARNFAQHADVAAEILVTASAGVGVFNNYASGVQGASGYLLPAADS